MPYQNDMATMAQLGVPAQAVAQQMQMGDQELQAKQLENERYAGQNPAMIAEPGLRNLFTQAQTSAEQGTAQQEQAKGQLAQSLLPGEINVGQAKQTTELSAQKVQQFNQIGTMAGQVADVMDNTLPALRPAKMRELAQGYGVDASVLGDLANGDPDKLRSFRDNIIRGTSDWQKAQLEATTRQNVATTEAAGHVQGAEVQANARKYASDNAVLIKQMSENIDQTIASLGRKIAAAGTNADPNDIQLMQTLQRQQIISRQMGAANTAYLVGQGQVAQAPSFVPTVPGQGNAPAPQAPTQQAPQGGGGGNALEQEMKRRGLL